MRSCVRQSLADAWSGTNKGKGRYQWKLGVIMEIDVHVGYVRKYRTYVIAGRGLIQILNVGVYRRVGKLGGGDKNFLFLGDSFCINQIP